MNSEIFQANSDLGSAIGSRIRQIRKSLQMTQKQFAETLGIVQGFLSAIEKGKKVPSDTLLIALQHLYKVSPEWINSGNGAPALSSDYAASPQTRNSDLIPLLSTLPTTKEESRTPIHVESYISLPGLPTGCFAITYSGDYMLPTIRDNDLVIVRPDDVATSGTICLIVGKWGEPLLRRYREIDDQPFFSADNSAYSPFQPDASTKILGIVIKIWREIKI